MRPQVFAALSRFRFQLRMRGLAGLPLGYDLARVLIERAGLRNQFDSLFELRIILQRDLETLIQSEGAGKDFALDLQFKPSQVFLNLGLGVLDVLLIEIFSEFIDDLVVHDEVLGDLGLGAEVETGEITDPLRSRVKHAAAIERELEIVLFGCGHKVVRSNATLSEDLPAAIGELYFGLLRPLRIVVVIVERNIFVIALNQAATRGVVTRSGEQQSSVFTERKLGLHQAFAEAIFTDHQAAIVILYGARNDFRRGGALPVDQHHHGNSDALIAAHGVVATLRGRTAAMRNNDFVFVEEHVGKADG